MGADECEIVEVEVKRYKNLHEVRVGWSPRVVLYGPNGVGKTNLFEVLGLAFGSRATLWQLAGRAEVPSAGAVSVLIRGTVRELPLEPDLSLRFWEARAHMAEETNPLIALLGGSGRFWSLLGAERGTSWAEAMRSGIVDGRLAELLVDLARKPLIRYGLESVTGLESARSVNREASLSDDWVGAGPVEVSFARRFSRCLAMPNPPPAWLVDLAPDLPAPFAPLRRSLAERPLTGSEYLDLLELPPSSSAPIRVIWLSSERTAGEAWSDLDEAFEAATGPAAELRFALDRLLFTKQDDDELTAQSDAEWWLAYKEAEAARAVLSWSMPHLSANPEDAHAAAIRIGRYEGAVPTGQSWWVDEPGLFERFSSGERTWVDIALAHSAAALENLAAETGWLRLGLERLSDEIIFAAAERLENQLDVFEDSGFWNAGDIDGAVALLRQLLGSAESIVNETHAGTELSDRLTLESLLSSDHGLQEALRATLTLHLYDEPERHLHPLAQRRIAHALTTDLGGDHVAISTHSHLFLGKPGWKHLHLTPTSEGTVVTEFDPKVLNLSHAITRQMGLTRGELLSRFRYVLFVEGPIDALVLHTLYGTWFSDANILVLPIHGADEAAALAELELIGEILDVGTGLLLDHVHRSRLRSSRLPAERTKEERVFSDLRRRLRLRARTLDEFGLEREDILAYLDEDLIRKQAPQFPGWKQTLQQRNRSENLKHAAERLSDTRFDQRLVTSVVQEMVSEGRIPTGDLGDVVADIIRTANEAAG